MQRDLKKFYCSVPKSRILDVCDLFPLSTCSLLKLPKPSVQGQTPGLNSGSWPAWSGVPRGDTWQGTDLEKFASTPTCIPPALRKTGKIIFFLCYTLTSFGEHFGKPCKGGLYKSQKILSLLEILQSVPYSTEQSKKRSYTNKFPSKQASEIWCIPHWVLCFPAPRSTSLWALGTQQHLLHALQGRVAESKNPAIGFYFQIALLKQITWFFPITILVSLFGQSALPPAASDLHMAIRIY